MANDYKNIVVLSGGVAYTDTDTFAVYNPTAAAISASLKGSIESGSVIRWTVGSGRYDRIYATLGRWPPGYISLSSFSQSDLNRIAQQLETRSRKTSLSNPAEKSDELLQ